MSTEVEISRVLATIATTLNDQRLEHYDTERMQQIVTGSLGGEQDLIVDDGGGVHESHGRPCRRDP
jgi:hypothetical protein